jgi:hypothetical protein
VKNACKDRTPLQKSSLVSDRFPPSITVKLATCLRQEVALLGQLYSAKVSGVLVDFHGVIPATFVPILKNPSANPPRGGVGVSKMGLARASERQKSERQRSQNAPASVRTEVSNLFKLFLKLEEWQS